MVPSGLACSARCRKSWQAALLRDGAHMVIACPSATRSPPYTQVLSGPRAYSSGALIRCPPGDQPGAGGKVRGITGPSSSAQRTVEPGGGLVYSVTTAVLVGRTPGR